MTIPYKIDKRFTFHREYRNALYQTLIKLKPKYCLEIGTNHGATARVFQAYFDEYMPDGKCITVDIKKYHELSLKNVVQILVNPWVDNPWEHHHGNDDELINDNRSNHRIILDAMQTHNIDLFDFFFIDGDHTEPSVKADWDLCTWLPSRFPCTILLDDTDESKHYSTKFAKQVDDADFEVETYENWPCRVGMNLFTER